MSKTLVIIPHYNKLALLKECLVHIEKQNYKSFDVMIIDNGSDDGSAEFIYNLQKNNMHYHSILLNENMGFAYAVNRGIEYSINNNYEYSLLLNNDAYIEQDFVLSLENSIKSNQKLFAVSSMMLSYNDKNKIDSFGDSYNILGFAFQNHLEENYEKINKNEFAFSACGGASIYRNSIFSEIGLFDETFFAYLEDVDISYRARIYGYKIKTCKEAICYHLGSATSGSKYNEFKVRTSARNNIFLIYKNMPALQIILNIIPLTIGTLLKQLFFIKKGFGLDYFFGLFDGFRNLKMLNKSTNGKNDILTYIYIEILLFNNTIKYIINYINRHS